MKTVATSIKKNKHNINLIIKDRLNCFIFMTKIIFKNKKIYISRSIANILAKK